MENILEDKSIEKTRSLVLGNEAIAYGLIDGGVKYVASYPGTPSTEIVEKLITENDPNCKGTWSANEAVAFEEAMAAAITGIDAGFVCKSVGLNVAMDPLMTICNAGTNAAFLIIVADDPAMHSSQNEQDNRLVSLISGLPVFEPSTAQEAYFYTREAILFSRKFKLPVIIRTVTRLSHSLTPLIREERIHLDDVPYVKDVARFVNIPGNARKNHQRVLAVHEEINEYVEHAGLWKEILTEEEPEHLFITCGNAANHLIEAIGDFEISAHIFIPKLLHPLPRGKIEELLHKYSNIFVVEELEPYLENKIKAIAQEMGKTTKIAGKGSITNRYGEITTEFLKEKLAGILEYEYKPPKLLDVYGESLLRMRPPVLCAGCPHRSTYVELRQALKQFGDDVVYCSDIGCYSLGVLPPHSAADILIAMGASINTATGIAMTQPDKLAVAVIGDSTFWHSGLSGLANAIWKNANILVVVVDNSTTAMTGSQPNPTSGEGPLDIVKVSEAMGAKTWKIDPMDYKESARTIKQIAKEDGVKVVVSYYPCALMKNREDAKNGVIKPLMKISEDKCSGCELCVTPLGCPALSMNKEKNIAEIDPSLCNSCTYCVQLCRHDAILEVFEN